MVNSDKALISIFRIFVFLRDVQRTKDGNIFNYPMVSKFTQFLWNCSSLFTCIHPIPRRTNKLHFLLTQSKTKGNLKLNMFELGYLQMNKNRILHHLIRMIHKFSCRNSYLGFCKFGLILHKQFGYHNLQWN